ncbi:outer membrane protein assembly factor BamE [Sinobacterium caligoides]|nr:outer membrane protein assembly factor BamE [Sinobacterium caligoides]
MQRLTTTLVLLVALAGCTEFPGIYKLDIAQGNVITQEMVDQLEPGMTRRQVKFILGSPLLQDTFNDDRWDYYYSLRSQSRPKPEQRMSLYFQGDKLTHFTGSLIPGGGAAVHDDSAINADAAFDDDDDDSAIEGEEVAPLKDASNTIPGDKSQDL